MMKKYQKYVKDTHIKNRNDLKKIKMIKNNKKLRKE